MSRWQGSAPQGISLRANLSPEERIADRLADIAVAADDILGIIRLTSHVPTDVELAITIIQRRATGVMPLLPYPATVPSCDPDLDEILQKVRQTLWAIEPLRGPERDASLGWAEAFAAPYAIAFYYELSA